MSAQAQPSPPPPGRQPQFALVVLDLQNDFFFPHGKLAASAGQGFDESFPDLVRSFRDKGTVIWTRTEFFDAKFFDSSDSTAGGDHVLVELPIDPEDESGASFLPPDASVTPELFLTVGLDEDEEELVAQPGTFGADFIPIAQELLDEARDDFLVKASYSAFNSTELLDQLRASGVSHLAICGSLSNVSVLATAFDASQHGLSVSVIEDCLSYCSLNAHRDALTCMRDDLGIKLVTAAQFTKDLAVVPSQRAATPPKRERVDTPELAVSPVKTSRSSSGLPSPPLEQSDGQHRSRKSLIPMRSAVDKLPRLRTLSHKSSNPTLLRQPSYNNSPALARSPLIGSDPDLLEMSRSMSPASVNGASTPRTLSRQSRLPMSTLGPGDSIGEGDSSIVYAKLDQTVLPQLSADGTEKLGDCLFGIVKDEVHWQKMYHISGEVPRLVCAQGDFEDDGAMPLYRHPADESLPLMRFSRAIRAIRDQVQRIIGHPLNHCLVQLYRGGQDFISEHSDKTLDIVRGSKIVNVSLGAQRVMRLRTKKVASTPAGSPLDGPIPGRTTQLVPMPNGSLFVLGPQTNMVWLHGINHDKRPDNARAPQERAFGGERISLTFRHIGTFLSADQDLIWGQGAESKIKEAARPVVSGEELKALELIQAFGAENKSVAFDWDAHYGRGFDVLHFAAGRKVERPVIFYSTSWPSDARVRIYLDEFKIPHEIAGVSGQAAGAKYKPTICLRDNDKQHTEVMGDMAILLYLERFHADNGVQDGYRQAMAARDLSLIFEVGTQVPKEATPALAAFEKRLADGPFLSGDKVSLADCVFWPIIDHMIDEQGEGWDRERWGKVTEYHARMLQRPAVENAVWTDAEEGP